MNVTGEATLGGTLAVSLINSFTPDYFDVFTVMTLDTLDGNFDQITGAFVNLDMTLVPILGSDLTLIAAFAGDGDLNGIVNFQDFALLSTSFGLSDTTWGQGNFNLDQVTNFEDFAILSNHFGQSVPTTASVPEPLSVILLGLGQIAAGRFAMQSPTSALTPA